MFYLSGMLQYFGTELNSAGHFFWELEGDKIYSNREMKWDSIPFNPEMFPIFDIGENMVNGLVKTYRIQGYSILAIYGSCADDRHGTRSVFFTRKAYNSPVEFQDEIKAMPIVQKIINKMTFQIKWLS